METGGEFLCHLVVGNLNPPAWKLDFQLWSAEGGTRKFTDPLLPTRAGGGTLDEITTQPDGEIPDCFPDNVHIERRGPVARFRKHKSRHPSFPAFARARESGDDGTENRLKATIAREGWRPSFRESALQTRRLFFRTWRKVTVERES